MFILNMQGFLQISSKIIIIFYKKNGQHFTAVSILPDGLHSVVMFICVISVLSIYFFTKHNSLQERIRCVIVTFT